MPSYYHPVQERSHHKKQKQQNINLRRMIDVVIFSKTFRNLEHRSDIGASPTTYYIITSSVCTFTSTINSFDPRTYFLIIQPSTWTDTHPLRPWDRSTMCPGTDSVHSRSGHRWLLAERWAPVAVPKCHPKCAPRWCPASAASKILADFPRVGTRCTCCFAVKRAAGPPGERATEKSARGEIGLPVCNNLYSSDMCL